MRLCCHCTGDGSDSRERSANLLQPGLWHHRYLGARSCQRCAIPLLCGHWLLDVSFLEQVDWATRNHLHLLFPCHRRRYLAGCNLRQVATLWLSFLHGSCHRRQVLHHTSLCRRVRPSSHSRCVGYAMADVDCIWNHDWFSCVRRFLQCQKRRSSRSQLAPHASLDFHPTHLRLRHDLLRP